MYIGLRNIQNIFSKNSTLLTHSDGLHCLTGWTKLDDAPRPYTDHLLYVCRYSDSLASCAFAREMHLLCIVEEGHNLSTAASAFPDHVSLLLVESGDPVSIYSQLQNYFNCQCGAGLFGATLLEFLAFEDGLQSAIEYSFRIFRNPIFVFDANYNLIAATWEAVRELNIQDQVVVNKHFTDDDFKMASRQNNIHNKVRKSEIPIRSYNEELGYEQMYCAINTQKDLGHICISAINRPFAENDTEMLLILKKYVHEQLKKDTFVRTSRGFHYEYFLRDLLDHKIATDRSNLMRMQYVASEFTGNLYCLVVETARSASTINSAMIRNILESRFPNTKTLIYNGQIITILSILTNQLIPEEYLTEAQKICVDHGLYAGMSNCFQDILKFEEFYNQALRAIELGICQTEKPYLFCYQDYYLEHVTNIFTLSESSETFCHPRMKFLLDYDKAHHSELAYTLYMYLIHERNLAATSEAMEMHRSSLVYRFRKINALIGENFEDCRERMYLILSYEMNKQ
ncbi:MAG: PucR family transcriptional regulator [Lachnospiraceae bacterium]|nr:PucR family transcriptional regulator [Lachnospiraceae bacterium]